jgi:hypothetical protein
VLQVLLAVGLALLVAVLAIELAEWRYARIDLSSDGRNELDPAIVDQIRRLDQEARVDVFFRPLVGVYAPVAAEAQSGMLELLYVARNAQRDRLEVVVYDPSDLEAVQARQRELGIEGSNRVVVSCGERKAVLDLWSDVAAIDWGNPTPAGLRYLLEQGIAAVIDPRRWRPEEESFQPAHLIDFRGAEAFGAALSRVASARAPRLGFARGHGEPDPFGSEAADLQRLRVALEQDGFAVQEWDPGQSASVPAEIEVLALIGSTQPWRAEELEAVRAWVDGGGRLVVGPSYDELARSMQSGLVALLGSWGMLGEPGVVCQAFGNRYGQEIVGVPQCASFVVDERGLASGLAITEPLRQRGRRVEFSLTHSFRRGVLARGTLLDVISSPSDSWRDRLGPGGQPDFVLDPASERKERVSLAMLAQFPARSARTAEPEATAGAPRGARREARVLGLASASFFSNGLFDTNRDFMLNAFNWLAEREAKLSVRPRPRGASRIDLEHGSDLAVLTGALALGLPTLCGLVGVALALARRR